MTPPSSTKMSGNTEKRNSFGVCVVCVCVCVCDLLRCDERDPLGGREMNAMLPNEELTKLRMLPMLDRCGSVVSFASQYVIIGSADQECFGFGGGQRTARSALDQQTQQGVQPADRASPSHGDLVIALGQQTEHDTVGFGHGGHIGCVLDARETRPTGPRTPRNTRRPCTRSSIRAFWRCETVVARSDDNRIVVIRLQWIVGPNGIARDERSCRDHGPLNGIVRDERSCRDRADADE